MFKNINQPDNQSNSFISLKQGKKFNKYQTKISDKTEKSASFIEGFDNLTEKTVDALQTNDTAKSQGALAKLQMEYDKTLQEYNTLYAGIQEKSNQYFSRVDGSNPYLGKNVQFSDGKVAYVTQQGLLKVYPDENVIKDTIGKNGCPAKDYAQLNIPWNSKYDTPGTELPTQPPLIVGTNMTSGQSCGNEGSSIVVNAAITSPKTSYIGCYNKDKPVTEILFVPTMNSSNNVNGYKSSASSIYTNNNNGFGPWGAFDQNKNTYWHSATGSAYNYDGKTGVYKGSNYKEYNSSGGVVKAQGEWLEMSCPVSVSLLKYAVQGRQNCCSQPNGRSPNSWIILGANDQGYEMVDKRENVALNYEKQTFYTNNANKYSKFVFITTNCGNPNQKDGSRYCVQISAWDLYTNSNEMSTSEATMSNSGLLTFEDCQKLAIESNNKYFSLDEIDANGKGKCYIGNDMAKIEMYGQGFVYSEVELWSSKTTNNGYSANVSEQGSLEVNNSADQAIFATDAAESEITNSYVGCYKDKKSRAMGNTSNNKYLPFDDCRQLAIDGNYKYFGTQDAGSGKGWCTASNDLNQVKKYGLAKNCRKDSNGNMLGSAWSNAVYSLDEEISYYLILQDDGNMCIYKGSGPNDNQGLIWSSNTKGKQDAANPNFSAAKSQYGRNYIVTGELLKPNQFIGSTNGSIYLLMKTDGNLVLLTNTKRDGCSSNNNMNYGTSSSNAVYQIKEHGDSDLLGKLAFIDPDGKLFSYDAKDTKFSNKYIKLGGLNTPNNDIAGAAYKEGFETKNKSCADTCNGIADCAGYVQTTGNESICWPKNSSMFPGGGSLNIDNNANTYIRTRVPTKTPIGISDSIHFVDSVQFQNYPIGDKPAERYGLNKATSVEKQKLDQLETRLDLLSKQLNNVSNKFSTGVDQLNNQYSENSEHINKYYKDIGRINRKINRMQNQNYTNIVNDSDIIVLKKNYEYMFWTILAAGTLLVAMSVGKPSTN